MSLRDDTARYGSLTRFLHWSLLVLVLAQFGLAFLMEQFEEGSAGGETAMAAHESVGVLVIAFALVFVLWRIANPRPSLEALPAWQRRLALATHWVIYGLILLQPLSGILMILNSEHGLKLFGVVTIGAGPGSESLKELGEAAHGVMPTVLLAALALHLLGALYHHYVAGDDILRRMLPGRH